MRDPRKNYIVVGTFLLVLLSALVVWLAVLSGRTEATHPYFMEFNNVMGLTEGAQILYEGYPAGQIEEILLFPDPDTPTYRLNVSIRQAWDIPDDSAAVITQAGFLSAVVVDIHAGKSTHMLAPGDQITSLGTTSVLRTISSVASKIEELSETTLRPLLENLTEGTGALKDLSIDVPIILKNLKTFSLELKDTTHRFKVFLGRNTQRVDTILADVEIASGNISGLTTEFRRTGKRIDHLLASMDNLISKNRATIDHSLTDLHYTLEVIATHVREIASNLESTTRNMNEFTAEIRRNPSTIIRGREFNADSETGN
jgi:phospholipid/cholesterol/gamma-HCH transport system substrate-binding protein